MLGIPFLLGAIVLGQAAAADPGNKQRRARRDPHPRACSGWTTAARVMRSSVITGEEPGLRGRGPDGSAPARAG
jgi:hypothetical protein